MQPRIVKSDLTKPARWYVATQYVVKRGINSAGEKHSYIVATRKYDVTDQMEAILKSEQGVARVGPADTQTGG